jgi:hypothetical protein
MRYALNRTLGDAGDVMHKAHTTGALADRRDDLRTYDHGRHEPDVSRGIATLQDVTGSVEYVFRVPNTCIWHGVVRRARRKRVVRLARRAYARIVAQWLPPRTSPFRRCNFAAIAATVLPKLRTRGVKRPNGIASCCCHRTRIPRKTMQVRNLG